MGKLILIFLYAISNKNQHYCSLNQFLKTDFEKLKYVQEL